MLAMAAMPEVEGVNPGAMVMRTRDGLWVSINQRVYLTSSGSYIYAGRHTHFPPLKDKPREETYPARDQGTPARDPFIWGRWN